jgi:hypothetical protein
LRYLVVPDPVRSRAESLLNVIVFLADDLGYETAIGIALPFARGKIIAVTNCRDEQRQSRLERFRAVHSSRPMLRALL